MRDQTGHRQRLKERFLQEGLDSFDEVQALELLLFYAIPRIDVKPLSRLLLDRFGSFPGVLQASREELMTVPGMGQGASAFLQLINQTHRYSLNREQDGPVVLNSVGDCKRYLRAKYFGRRDETVYLLCLDGKRRLINCVLLNQGDLNSSAIPTRKLVEAALCANAASVILSHNHPGGLALPSNEDCRSTSQVGQLLAGLGILLEDHIIMADEDGVSLRESGLYHPPRI